MMNGRSFTANGCSLNDRFTRELFSSIRSQLAHLPETTEGVHSAAGHVDLIQYTFHTLLSQASQCVARLVLVRSYDLMDDPSKVGEEAHLQSAARLLLETYSRLYSAWVTATQDPLFVRVMGAHMLWRLIPSFTGSSPSPRQPITSWDVAFDTLRYHMQQMHSHIQTTNWINSNARVGRNRERRPIGSLYTPAQTLRGLRKVCQWGIGTIGTPTLDPILTFHPHGHADASIGLPRVDAFSLADELVQSLRAEATQLCLEHNEKVPQANTLQDLEQATLGVLLSSMTVNSLLVRSFRSEGVADFGDNFPEAAAQHLDYFRHSLSHLRTTWKGLIADDTSGELDRLPLANLCQRDEDSFEAGEAKFRNVNEALYSASGSEAISKSDLKVLVQEIRQVDRFAINQVKRVVQSPEEICPSTIVGSELQSMSDVPTYETLSTVDDDEGHSQITNDWEAVGSPVLLDTPALNSVRTPKSKDKISARSCSCPPAILRTATAGLDSPSFEAFEQGTYETPLIPDWEVVDCPTLQAIDSVAYRFPRSKDVHPRSQSCPPRPIESDQEEEVEEEGYIECDEVPKMGLGSGSLHDRDWVIS